MKKQNKEEKLKSKQYQILKELFNDEKRNAISMQDDIINPVTEYKTKPAEKPNYDKSSASSSKIKYKNINSEIPNIQIKVGVQNNNYSFFNTINESDEDEDLYTIIGIGNLKNEWNPSDTKSRREFYKRRNIDPPIDTKSQNRRYKESIENRKRIQTSSRDRELN